MNTRAQAPSTREAEQRLRVLERAVASATPRPSSMSEREQAWQRMIAQGDGRPFNEAERLDHHLERIDALQEILRQDRAMRRLEQPQAVFARPNLEQRCFGNVLRDCRVAATGLVVSEDRGTRILWQAQRGFTERDGLRAGIVLLAEVRGGWRLLGWSFEGHTYEAPRLVTHEDAVLLHVRGLAGGMGRGEADLLYRRGREGWDEIEVEGWWAALPNRLPPGLELRQAVPIDIADMVAEARLSRAEDANCCPAGGTAILDFRIEGRRLVLAGLQLDAVARAAQPGVAACPAERASYRLQAQTDWRAELRREGPPASDASDLLLRVHAGDSGPAYWFRFAAAHGYGGLTLWPVAAPGRNVEAEGTQDLEVADGFQIAVHPVAADMEVLPDAPRSGAAAPRWLFLPELGRLLAYGELPQQGVTPAPLGERMQPGFWALSACR
ncbi:MAG: hypothetical protein WCP77_07395 [Roseococcus sp.]